MDFFLVVALALVAAIVAGTNYALHKEAAARTRRKERFDAALEKVSNVYGNTLKRLEYPMLRYKKLHPDAKPPTRGKPGDAGMDLTAIDDGKTNAHSDYIEYDTGVAIELPPNHVALVFPRSSISTYRLSLANAVAVIDSNFRGSIKLRFRMLSETPSLRYKAGDRIGQLIVLPYPEVVLVETDTLSSTDRGEGGFGSSGS